MTHTEVSFAMKTLMVMILGSQPSRYRMPLVNCVSINTSIPIETSRLFSGMWDSAVGLSTLPLFAHDHSSCCRISFLLPNSFYFNQLHKGLQYLSVSPISAQPCYVSKSLLLPFLLFLNALHSLGICLNGQSIPWTRTRTWVQILQRT